MYKQNAEKNTKYLLTVYQKSDCKFLNSKFKLGNANTVIIANSFYTIKKLKRKFSQEPHREQSPHPLVRTFKNITSAHTLRARFSTKAIR